MAVSCPGATQVKVFLSSGKLLSALDFHGQLVPYGLAFENETTILLADEVSAGVIRVRFESKP